jgi:Peptidase family M48
LLSPFGVASAGQTSALNSRVDAIPNAALLSQPATALVDPARQAAAIRRAHWTVFGWFLIQIFQAVALFYFWSSGNAASLRDALRRRIRSERDVRFLFGGALALIARIAAFAPSFYLYRVDRALDLTFELTRYWLLYWLLHTMLAMVIAGIVAAVVLWLASRTHQWYVYAILGILGVSVAWSFLNPFRAQVLQGSTGPEVRYDAAVAMGHAVHGDQLSIGLIEGGIIIVFAALAVVIADRVPFRRDDDPLARLAIVGALLALVYIAAVPVRNAGFRPYDLSADAYAVARTGDPAAAVRTLVRGSDQRMIEVCPELSATFFLYTTPAVGTRIAAINHIPSACP